MCLCFLRTIKPIWTLFWPWRTGRSQQPYSTYLSFWIWRIKDISMSSLSTTSSGYQLETLHTNTPVYSNSTWVIQSSVLQQVQRHTRLSHFSVHCSSGHSGADEAAQSGARLLPGRQGTLYRHSVNVSDYYLSLTIHMLHD